MPRKPLYLSGDAKAGTLLTKTPLALVIGLVLDQKVQQPRVRSVSGTVVCTRAGSAA